jgi:V/A-type H+/Na+-transporting ATPase subunit C
VSIVSHSADFVYGNTRLRARKAALLSSAGFETLLNRDLEGVLEGLAATAYRPDIEAASAIPPGERALQEIVRRHLARVLEEMRTFYDGSARSLVDLLLARFDLHNLLALLRGLVRRQEPERVLASVVPLGSLGGGAAREIAHQPEPIAAVDRLVAWRLPDRESAGALTAAWPEFERTEDLRALEHALATAHARKLEQVLVAAGPAAQPLRNLMARESDAANILVALRLWCALERGEFTELPPPPAAGRFLTGGTIAEQALDSALRLPTRANATAELAAASRRPRWRAPLERFAAGDDLAGLQRAFEADRVRWAVGLFLGGDPLGVDVPIAYALAVENEARNLRLVGEAAAAHQPAEAVRPLLLLPGDGDAWAA